MNLKVIFPRKSVPTMNTAIWLHSSMYFQCICSSVKSEWNPRVILPRKSVHHHIYLCFVWMWTSRLYFRENLFPQWTQLWGFSQECTSKVSVHPLNMSETQGLYFWENLLPLWTHVYRFSLVCSSTVSVLHHIYLCFVWMWTSRLYFRENLFPQWIQL